jgi:hypothetical protein
MKQQRVPANRRHLTAKPRHVSADTGPGNPTTDTGTLFNQPDDPTNVAMTRTTTTVDILGTERKKWHQHGALKMTARST